MLKRFEIAQRRAKIAETLLKLGLIFVAFFVAKNKKRWVWQSFLLYEIGRLPVNELFELRIMLVVVMIARSMLKSVAHKTRNVGRRLITIQTVNF